MKQSDAGKEAKFFCESCGSEVPRQSRFCPTCGKFFASVRCPQCGKTGNTDDFKEGCPRCGYAVNSGLNLPNTGTKNIQSSSVKNRDRHFFSGGNGHGKKASGSDSAPPLWAYVLALGVLGVLIVILYSCL